LPQLIIIVAMFAALWLIWIGPQRRRIQEQRKLFDSVQVGDEIVTAGGLYGHVRAIGDGQELTLEIAPGTQVRVARRAVAAVLPPEEEGEETLALEQGEDVEQDEEVRS
jgi:preprotein translocase subunit YajC